MIAAAGGGMLLLAVIVIIVVSSGGKDGNAAGPGGERVKTEKDFDPYDVARTKAQNGNYDETKRLAEMAWNRFNSAKGRNAEDEKKYRRHWRWAYKQILRREPQNAIAHERMGDILFDLKEAQSLADLEAVSESVRDDLLMLIEDIEANHEASLKKNRGRLWLEPRDKEAKAWLDLKGRLEKHRKATTERATDSFYPEAERYGNKLASDLASDLVDFRLDGIKDAPFSVFVHKPYVFIVQRASAGFEDRVASKWNDVLQQLLETFYGEYGEGANLTPITKPTPIVILRKASEYTKYMVRNDTDDQSLTPVTSAGHFEPGTGRMICYESTEQAERTTLFHEGTHQIVSWAMRRALGAGARQSLWFSEGLADYFGGHAPAVRDGKTVYVPGRINEGRIDTLVKSKAREDLFSFEDLLAYPRSQYVRDNTDPTKSRKVLNAYAQGWALCYFLQTWKKEKYGGQKWIDYLKQEFGGRSGKAAFTSVYGAANLAVMSKEYLEMIDELGKAKKEGRIVNGEIIK